METDLQIVSQVDEISIQDDRVSLCLLINRRQGVMRVIDFRSGPNPAKRGYIMEQVEAQGVSRVVTLVEREEVASWARIGFLKEGSIPAFYKRSDAHILGMLVGADLRADESGARPVALDYAARVNTSAVIAAYGAARAAAKAHEGAEPPAVRVQPARPADVERALASAARAGRLASHLEPFSRDVERQAFMATARGGFSLLVSVESQPCYANAFVELVQAPRTEKEARLTAAALIHVMQRLLEQQMVSAFAVTAVEDAELAACFIQAGFRRTGYLQGHLIVANERRDAFLWSRKLASPGGPGARDGEF
ncbi:MAG: hypothetical protein KIT72_06095 [Polyangiaceae bacterium]|nr:hypothetical protein [Polyangiaceae bacterium]MCW5789971.1 hypothetical protein [Polyangiaceae bacterium]